MDEPPTAWIKRVNPPSAAGPAFQVVIDCPHCGREHRHGAGLDGSRLGTRVPHCSPLRRDYELRYRENVRPLASAEHRAAERAAEDRSAKLAEQAALGDVNGDTAQQVDEHGWPITSRPGGGARPIAEHSAVSKLDTTEDGWPDPGRAGGVR